MLDTLMGYFSHDIGIDLGTANTLVYVKGKGILIREPSVVTIHKKTKEVLAVGLEAKRMLGKTPQNIVAIRPLKEGVISDFYVTEKMLEYFIKAVHDLPSMLPKIPRPRVVIGVPTGITSVEKKAVLDAAKSAGARQTFLIEEPMASAIGLGLNVTEPKGLMVLDLGGGTTEIAVISLGGIVINKSLKIAGDSIDKAIVEYAKDKYNLLVGDKNAEDIKLNIGSVLEFENEKEATAFLSGRDLRNGLPKSVLVSAFEIRECLKPLIYKILYAIKEIMEETPPELLPDILNDGIYLAGGSSLLRKLDVLFSNELKVKINTVKDPMSCVVKGCSLVLANNDLLKRVKLNL